MCSRRTCCLYGIGWWYVGNCIVRNSLILLSGVTDQSCSVAGPLLGGVFTDKVTWRLCFYINLPLGAITIGTVIFVYHESGEHKVKLNGWREYLKSFDPTGNLVLIPAVICLFLALQWGGTTYAWSNGRIIALFVVFGILISIFIFLQIWNQDNAMIPPKLLKIRSVWAAVAFNFFIAASFFILAYYIPIWFQQVPQFEIDCLL